LDLYAQHIPVGDKDRVYEYLRGAAYQDGTRGSPSMECAHDDATTCSDVGVSGAWSTGGGTAWAAGDKYLFRPEYLEIKTTGGVSDPETLKESAEL
jgi:hypothetical protein